SAIADDDYIPTVTEVNANAPASLDVTCAVLAGTFAPTQNVSRASAPRRMCSITSLERITGVTESIPDISCAVDPQAAAGSDGKKAFETLTAGLAGFLVARFGLDRYEEWKAGQFVNVYPVRLGPGLITNPSEDGAEFIVVQPVDLRGPI